MQSIRISLLITVYHGINPVWFEQCMESVYKQKEYIDEIVLVEDGKLTAELNESIVRWKEKLPINIVKLEKNQGPGKAAQAGLNKCSHEWVARLDADDIADENRFATQKKILEEQEELDVLGGYLPEFAQEPQQIFAVNPLPLQHADIVKMMKLRCSINNCSVIFRKQKALEVGGYESLVTHEDYLLWFKMIKAGAIFRNLSQSMGYVRTNKHSYERRRGWFAIRQEIIFQNTLRRRGYITNMEYLRNMALRLPPRLLPASLMKIFYIVFLRQRRMA